MKLPSLRIAIPAIFVVWCVAGVMTHGWVMLAYPAMWGAVGGLFLVLHTMLRAQPAPAGVDPAAVGDAGRAPPAGEPTAAKEEASAAV